MVLSAPGARQLIPGSGDDRMVLMALTQELWVGNVNIQITEKLQGNKY
jgi:hypothetical protein